MSARETIVGGRSGPSRHGLSVAEADVVTAAEAVELARALSAILPPALVSTFGARFIRSGDLYDEFIARLALGVLRETGLGDAAKEPGTSAELVRRAGLDPARALIPVDWVLRRLAARGLLDERSESGAPPRFHARQSLPQLDPAILREEQVREDPSWLPSYRLAETVARDYPAFLRGERAGETLLFSPARLHLWTEFFSNDNGLYAVNNRVGAVAATRWLSPGDVTILEIGGGLGSAAIALLEELDAAGRGGEVRHYRFTDVVPLFLRRGQQALESRFAGRRAFAFASLDMNGPLARQGIAPASYSLIYAVNTLHVARDLDVTLGELREALAPGGVLVMSECVRLAPGQAVYAEFIFNLLESFRSPVLHPAYRPNGGFLTPEQWRSALEASGFVDVTFLPDVDRVRPSFPKFYVMAIGGRRP